MQSVHPRDALEGLIRKHVGRERLLVLLIRLDDVLGESLQVELDQQIILSELSRRPTP